jgi:hypothetical protein
VIRIIQISDNFAGVPVKISDNFTGMKNLFTFAGKNYDKEFVSASASAFAKERIYDYYRRPPDGEIDIDKAVKRVLSGDRHALLISQSGKQKCADAFERISV